MTESGIFNPPPFYKREGFIRGATYVILIGSSIILFRQELINVWNQLWRPIWPVSTEAIQSFLILLWNGFLFLITFFLIFLLVSQYLLPAQNNEQRKKVFDRLLSYLLRQHGPAVFIKEGKEIAKESELLSSKPGVAFVDLTSALALEKQSPPRATPTSSRISTIDTESSSPFSPSHIFDRPTRRGPKAAAVRITGPGITFTESGEKIRGVVDLRPQIRSRRGVRAYTREGIEIETSITTMFTLGQPPDTILVVYEGDQKAENLRTVLIAEKTTSDAGGQPIKQRVIEKLIDGFDEADKEEIHRFIRDYNQTGGLTRIPSFTPPGAPTSPFIFNPARIFTAIYASSLDVKEDGYKEWTELPLYLATEIFRNLLAGEIYDYLFFPADPRKFPLQDLKSNFALRMRYQGVLGYQFVENKTTTPFAVGQVWDESLHVYYPPQLLRNPKVLRARGIKVIHASFSELTPVNPGVRGQLLDNWSSYWESEAQQTLMEFELEKTRILNRARIEAQINLKETLMKLLESSSLADDALALRMLQALEGVAADPVTREFLPPETIHMLNSIWEWLLTDTQMERLPPSVYGGVHPGDEVEFFEPVAEDSEEEADIQNNEGDEPSDENEVNRDNEPEAAD